VNRSGHNHAVRRTLHLVAGFLAVFIAGDLLLGRMRLPSPDGSTNAVRRKWQALLDSGYDPDVVILGSSFEEFGVNPEVLDTQAERFLGRPVTSYNLAVPAASLNTEYLIVRNMLRSDYRPKVAYLGITPFAVDIARKDWLHNGLRAFGELEDLPGVWDTDPGAFGETLFTSLSQSYYLWNDARLLSERVALAVPLQGESAIDDGARGWRAWRGKQRPQSHRAAPVEHGAVPMSRRFALDNINGVRIRDAVAALRDCGIRVRLLELPLASTALADSAPRKNASYRAFVATLVAAVDVPLVTPPDGLLRDEDYFDDGHLTPEGAEKLSSWLSKDVAQALSESAGRVATR